MSEEVLIEVEGCVGSLVLNRPKALNALTLPLVEALTEGLRQHQQNPDVRCVVMRSSSPKAFCAGGDMRRIREAVLAGDRAYAMRFFGDEFVLDKMIADCAKPYVSLIDGICMGGGMGLSVHGRYRVVTERAVLAMPESAIGYMADVGATYFLPRLPGNLGKWIGLTGHRVTGGDAVHAGLATHYVPSERMDELYNALVAGSEPVESTLAAFAATAPQGETSSHLADADRHFASWNLTEIADSLRSDPGDFAKRTLAEMQALSPHAMALTLALMQDGAHSSLEQCLANELRAIETAVEHPDFIEGVRSVLVDKDRSARWAKSFDEVTAKASR